MPVLMIQKFDLEIRLDFAIGERLVYCFSMKTFLSLATILMLTGSGCVGAKRASVTPTPALPPSSPVADVAPQAAPLGSNGIIVEDQKAGAEVKIGNVVLAKQGYVVIHADANGSPGKIIAASALLNAGETRDVIVKTTIEPGVSYWAMLHADNGNKKYSEAEDQPVPDKNNAIIMKRFRGEGEAAAKTDVKIGATTSTASAKIDGFTFSPKTMSVKKGAKIIFTNMDGVNHTVTADGGAFTSASLQQGQSYTLDTSALATGSYGYHCAPHPFMKGVLVVE